MQVEVVDAVYLDLRARRQLLERLGAHKTCAWCHISKPITAFDLASEICQVCGPSRYRHFEGRL